MENQRSRTCVWLVNTLLNYQRLSLAEISELWCSATDLSGGEAMSRLKLNRTISSAFDMLGVVIECDRRDGYRYYIAANDNVKAAEWLISSYAVNQVLTESTHIRDRILLEEIPSGQHHLSTLVSAMSAGKALEMVYRKFADSEAVTSFIEPYCVKLSQQRWYLLACKDHRSHLQVFSLDRIQQLRILHDQPFTPPADFSPQEYFESYFGVYTGESIPPQHILIRANLFWRNYLRTLPMHASQQEVQTLPDASVFRYTLADTPDLLNHILSYGAGIEVLEPLTLRDKVRQAIRQMSELY